MHAGALRRSRSPPSYACLTAPSPPRPQDRADVMADVAVFARAAAELCVVRGVRDTGALRFPDGCVPCA